jgi:hypothetical protein
VAFLVSSEEESHWMICPDFLTYKYILYDPDFTVQAVEGIDDTFLSQGLSLDLLQGNW